MRCRLMIAALAAGACGHKDDARAARQPPAWQHDGALAYREEPDVATAVADLIAEDDPRVIGFGELHSRTDRANVTSSLAHFTKEVFPAVKDRLSDLVLETWIVDPKCGEGAKTATAAVEGAMMRPQSTKSELAQLIEAARAAKVQPHAMHLGCDDYAKVAPPGQEIQIEVMLDLITRELGRLATAAAAKAPAGKIIATYGGALHNDRFPNPGVASWSFADRVDHAVAGKYDEIDLYVPELAAEDPASKNEAWFPLLGRAAKDHVVVIQRGAKSYIVLLPTS
ncbi:MAG TPA: hypothetical protein VL463_32020 [Kofleriaceae bacterium]|nr:hypothetical protein [Kofleriaceae bacterium]